MLHRNLLYDFLNKFSLKKQSNLILKFLQHLAYIEDTTKLHMLYTGRSILLTIELFSKFDFAHQLKN
jgi:hypothetical protein